MELDQQEKELYKKIVSIKQKMGEKLLILTHHYQRPEIVSLGDYKGDSFELARQAASSQVAEIIVFCGVHFMAEAAATLAGPGQQVYMPDTRAGCPMADMSSLEDVEILWNQLKSQGMEKKFVPVTYMNSSSEIKAFCGERGGSVCTSSNAELIFKWVFSQDKAILFLPDRHLGYNTLKTLEVDDKDIRLWEYRDPNFQVLEDLESMENCRAILWDGHCHVHTHFKVEMIEKGRKKFPNAKIIVHPECPYPVVQAADAAGSTRFIVDTVDNAQPGETILIGTEINMIRRIHDQYPDKNIYELDRSLCPNMFRINLQNLSQLLEEFPLSQQITVEEKVRKGAARALQMMLDLCK